MPLSHSSMLKCNFISYNGLQKKEGSSSVQRTPSFRQVLAARYPCAGGCWLLLKPLEKQG